MAKWTPKGRHQITFVGGVDLEVAFLGACGLHTRAIARMTKLSESMVQYRLSKAGISRRLYRDGKNEIAKRTISVMRPLLTPDMRDHISPQFTVGD